MQLSSIVSDCWRLLKLRADSKSQTVTFEIAANAANVWADARATRQICLNLMSNALKFTPRGGHILISVASMPDGGQMLSVKDNGPGIPASEIHKVMQPFGQGSLAQQTAEGGTGLGLPIVKGLIELHGGVFELKSELRKGTTAEVRFPAQRVLQVMTPLSAQGGGQVSGQLSIKHAFQSTAKSGAPTAAQTAPSDAAGHASTDAAAATPISRKRHFFAQRSTPASPTPSAPLAAQPPAPASAISAPAPSQPETPPAPIRERRLPRNLAAASNAIVTKRGTDAA